MASELDQPFPDRRHDLDALRAGAMLLGIGLHAALSYVTFPFWPVSDESNHTLFDFIFSAIHGFRMPLFFMISGFFTAMLWRKRGILSLAKQRSLRILIPLLIFLVPINLLTFAIIASHTTLEKTRKSSTPEQTSIWTAARDNDVDALRDYLSVLDDINELDPKYRLSPLHWAAINGSTDAAHVLIEAGAKVDHRSQDRSTPLGHAAFGAHPEIVELLLDSGADPNSVNQHQSTPLDSVRADQETLDWIARMLNLTVNEESLRERREHTTRLLVEAGGLPNEQLVVTATDQNMSLLDRISSAYLSFSRSPGFRAADIFGHLWFLWFLCLLLIPFLAYAGIADRISWQGPPRWLFNTPLALLWIVPLTMIPQWFHGLEMAGFGPDTSASLLPPPHILLLYGVFFFFGALYFDCNDRQSGLTKGWWLLLPLALLVVYPVGMVLTYQQDSPSINALIPSPLIRPLAVFMQTLYAWLMIIGLMGLFRKVCSSESKTIRYLSDAAYWLYIAHLPFIFLFQALAKPLNLHAVSKFALVTIAVTALLLIVYDRLIRYTWIGTLLNGKRSRPSSSTTPSR
ncbi:MAG: acyltransferase family protein [Verrucomicrobiota bacterium]